MQVLEGKQALKNPKYKNQAIQRIIKFMSPITNDYSIQWKQKPQIMIKTQFKKLILKSTLSAQKRELLSRKFPGVSMIWSLKINDGQVNPILIHGTVRILKNHHLSSLFVNPIKQNLNDFTNQYNKKFDCDPFKIILIPELQESITIKTSFYLVKIEKRLKQLVEEISLFVLQIYQKHHWKDQPNQNQDKELRLHGMQSLQPHHDNPKHHDKQTEEDSRNIKVMDYDIQQTPEEDLVDERWSDKVFIGNINVTGDVLFTVAPGVQQVAERIERKDLLIRLAKLQQYRLTTGERFSYIDVEKDTLLKLRNVLKSKFIGTFYLRRTENREDVQGVVYSQSYYHEKNLLQKKKNVNQYFKNLKSYAYQLLHALLHLHQNKIIHCDIKPSNIMIEKRKGPLRIKVIDLGGMIPLNEPAYFYRSAEMRRQFSTRGYYYQNNNVTNWNHPLFDMYGFGRTLQHIVESSPILQTEENTQIDEDRNRLHKMAQRCMEDPDRVTQTYETLIEQVEQMQ